MQITIGCKQFLLFENGSYFSKTKFRKFGFFKLKMTVVNENNIFSAFSLESNALKGPLWLAGWPTGWLAASKTRRRKHVETSGFLH